MLLRPLRISLFLLTALLFCGNSAHAASAKKDILFNALKEEMARSWETLRTEGEAPLYYLGYEVTEAWTYELSARLGAIQAEEDRHFRTLDIDVRVGSPQLDNTHQLKGRQSWNEESKRTAVAVPLGDDADAIKTTAWLHTDEAFQEAKNRYIRVRTNKAVTSDEEDTSPDFSKAENARHYKPLEPLKVDTEEWAHRLRRLSAALKRHPFILDSSVDFSVHTNNRFLVTSEDTEIVTGERFIRLIVSMQARTEDGMDLERVRSYDADRMRDIPSDDKILKDMEEAAEELRLLHTAPIIDPYTGPAIFLHRAAAVFFHEILGHRLEGHRQKLEDEGQTFAKKLGEPITADFISVYDDATMDSFHGQFLRGTYRYDNEGIPSQRVELVKNGVLTGFLLSRSPIRGFPHSNGHGRRSAGRAVVARMGNTIVRVAKTVSFSRLREMLIEEVRRQGKEYGLLFTDIGGGYTNTTRSSAQSFKVLPKLVYRVYPDGRPDEPVRGADIVGTPLNSFGKILAAADDYGIFNGTCGAESGWVPVSAIAPSLLISEVEVEKNLKTGQTPPLLAPPLHDTEARP